MRPLSVNSWVLMKSNCTAGQPQTRYRVLPLRTLWSGTTSRFHLGPPQQDMFGVGGEGRLGGVYGVFGAFGPTSGMQVGCAMWE